MGVSIPSSATKPGSFKDLDQLIDPAPARSAATYGQTQLGDDVMMNLKIWSKPSVEIVQLASAKGGSFNATDNKMTHRSN